MTVTMVMFAMEVIVEDVLMGLFLIQTKRNVCASNPRSQKYWSMECANVSISSDVYLCTTYTVLVFPIANKDVTTNAPFSPRLLLG